MNYMTFKDKDNISYVLYQVYYNNKECINCYFISLEQARYNILPYNLKDENEFNVVKQWLISFIINSKLFYQNVDMSTISYNQIII